MMSGACPTSQSRTTEEFRVIRVGEDNEDVLRRVPVIHHGNQIRLGKNDANASIWHRRGDTSPLTTSLRFARATFSTSTSSAVVTVTRRFRFAPQSLELIPRLKFAMIEGGSNMRLPIEQDNDFVAHG